MAARKPAPKPEPAPDGLAVDQVPVGDLVPDQKNARKGDVASLMASLKEFGQHRPIVAQRGTNRVLIGNHMLAAAIALGWETIAVTFVDDDEDKATRRALADNLVADRAKWDNDQLRSLLSELDDAVSLPGMDNVALERLLADQDAAEVPAEPLLPIVPRPGEEYNYVVVVAKTDMDNAWLAETMGLVSMASYKAKRTGVSRVIDVEHLKAAINRAIERGQTL